MKKAIAALFVLCLLAGTLAGCSSKTQSPQEGLVDLTNQMSAVSQGEFDLQVTVSSTALSEQSTGDIVVHLTGAYNTDAREMAGEISASVGQFSVQLTDMVVKDNSVYVNMRSVYGAMGTLMGSSFDGDELDAMLGGANYLCYELTTDLWMQSDSLQTVSDNLTTVFYNTIEDLALATDNEGTYGFALEGDNIKTVGQALLDDMNANTDSYADAIWTYVEEVASLSDLAGEDLGSKDEYMTDFRNILDELQTALDDSDFTGTLVDYAILYDKDAAVYTAAASITDGTDMDVAVTYTIKDTQVDAVTVPDNIITSDEMVENSESYYDDYYGYNSDDSSDLVPEAADNGAETAEGYNTIISSELTTFVNRDLSGYESLNTYNLVFSDISVQVPDMGEESLEGGDGLVTVSDGISQYCSVDLQDLDGDLSERAAQILDEMKLYTDFGYTDISVSDILVSSDNTVCLFSVAYTADDGGPTTDICVLAQSEDSSGIIIMMGLEIDSDMLSTQNSSFLFELGELLGVNLFELSGLDEASLTA